MTVWATHHRPTSLTGIVGQDQLVAELHQVVVGEMPMQHYIFFSPMAGTGKTSMAIALAKDLGWQIVTFNASSKRERGIEFIEEVIIPMTRSGVKERIFLLDEADQLTDAAQSALKGVIENANGYFILTCNRLPKVSRWLQSRCQVRTFSPIPNEDMVQQLTKIAVQHAPDISKTAVEVIAKGHEGDLRNAIGALQTYCGMTGRNAEAFLDSLTAPHIDFSKMLIVCFREKNLETAVKMLKGDVRYQIRACFQYAVESPAKAQSKMKVIEAAITAERDIINGVDEEVVRYNFVRMLVGGSQ
jgi:DNA polymerase III delta prime subunit